MKPADIYDLSPEEMRTDMSVRYLDDDKPQPNRHERRAQRAKDRRNLKEKADDRVR